MPLLAVSPGATAKIYPCSSSSNGEEKVDFAVFIERSRRGSGLGTERAPYNETDKAVPGPLPDEGPSRTLAITGFVALMKTRPA